MKLQVESSFLFLCPALLVGKVTKDVLKSLTQK